MMNREKYLATFERKIWRTMLDAEDVYNGMIPTKKYRCGDIAKESKGMSTQYVSAIMKRLVTMGLVKKEKVKTGKIIELTTETRVVRDPKTGWYKEVEVQREQPVKIEETITYFEKI
jgi:CTP-dependent riboflavin kinase